MRIKEGVGRELIDVGTTLASVQWTATGAVGANSTLVSVSIQEHQTSCSRSRLCSCLCLCLCVRVVVGVLVIAFVVLCAVNGRAPLFAAH